MDDRSALIALNMMEQVGPVTAGLLSGALGSYSGIFEASADSMLAVEGVGRRKVEAIMSQRDRVEWSREEGLAAAAGIRIITCLDEEYPDILRHIHDPPLALYIRGDFESGDENSVAVVGTRRPTHYGREVAESFSFSLTKAGTTVVSGLAAGIDTCAHRGALKAGGRTIAVMGGGFDHIYPASNVSLCDGIAEAGAVVTELPLSKRPDKSTFPMRNRIVSGISRGVVVVEAGCKSGALITASEALDHGRQVFAVPGRIDSPRSFGTNTLIRDGAKLVCSVDDILEEFGDMFRAQRNDFSSGNSAFI